MESTYTPANTNRNSKMKEIESNIKPDNEAQASYRFLLSMAAEQQPTGTTCKVIEAVLPWFVRGSSNTQNAIRSALGYIQNPLIYGMSEAQRKEMTRCEPILKLANAWNSVLSAETVNSIISADENDKILKASVNRVEMLRKNATELIQTTDLSGISDRDLKRVVDHFTSEEKIK